MSHVVDVIDAACTADAVMEACLLCEGAEVYCLGPPPEGVRAGHGQRLRPVSIPLTFHGLGHRLRGLDVHRNIPRCWSAAAAAKLRAASDEPSPVAIVRVGVLPDEKAKRALLNLARRDRLVAVCACASLAGRLGEMALTAEIVVIPPPAAPAPGMTAAGRARLRQELGIAADEFALVAPGAAHRQSGHRYAVWAVAILAEARFPIRLILPDTGPGARAVADFAADAGFDRQVVLAGPQHSLGELLPAADAAIFLGSPDVPPAALAAAMAAGLPIVAANIPQAADWLVAGRDALLVDPQAPRRIAQALLSLVEDPAAGQRLGQSAAARARELFDPAAVAAQWRQLVDRLAPGARGAPATVAKLA
jgi:glycosyltransferase involved in cell wall biosynthesis